ARRAAEFFGMFAQGSIGERAVFCSLSFAYRLQGIWTGSGALLLSAFLLWLTRARLQVIESSDRARIEYERPPFVVVAPMAGRVVASRLVLHEWGRAGDVVLEIDSSAQRACPRGEGGGAGGAPGSRWRRSAPRRRASAPSSRRSRPSAFHACA